MCIAVKPGRNSRKQGSNHGVSAWQGLQMLKLQADNIQLRSDSNLTGPRSGPSGRRFHLVMEPWERVRRAVRFSLIGEVLSSLS